MKKTLPRRDFLKQTALAAGAAALPFAGASLFAQPPAAFPANTAPRPHFPTADPAWAITWDAALAILAGNVRSMPRYEHPVLVEGSTYAGIWQECAPQEGHVYGTLQKYVATPAGIPTPLETARANHMAFFAQQKPDGQLSASIKLADKVGTGAGYGQIQMVVPIAATAWDIFQVTHDQELLETAYKSCSLWDAWLRQYRDTRKTGLVEGFCTYDTGMDNSPRWKGVRNQCPGADARTCPPDPGVPRLCPDLSATVYGGRIALAAMAKALNKRDDHARWLADAEHIRQLILTRLYSPEDAAFYDLDTDNKFVKVRSVVTIRVLGEHVLDPHTDKHLFNDIWTKQVHNPAAFWAPYPFPSSALNEPTFVRPIPRNSWGGAS
ncbi:MAG TPA: twin-arginine translocation signal domain-containing protein, partial [Opitutaceae bacterium]|nr:twin-arginine translocation signal domain-containing protein [Opitutaceae bacterium]